MRQVLVRVRNMVLVKPPRLFQLGREDGDNNGRRKNQGNGFGLPPLVPRSWFLWGKSEFFTESAEREHNLAESRRKRKTAQQTR